MGERGEEVESGRVCGCRISSEGGWTSENRRSPIRKWDRRDPDMDLGGIRNGPIRATGLHLLQLPNLNGEGFCRS